VSDCDQRYFRVVRIGPQTRREVAVVLPCYNVEECVQRALDSIFLQTYNDLHVYAVDDGSTDNTLQILKKSSSWCTVLSQSRRGPACARNRAVAMSDSEFVAFLDADDEWLPYKLERQISFLKQEPSVGLVCSLCAVQDSGSKSAVKAPNIPLSGRLFEHLARNCFVFTPTVVVRRCCLEEVGLFNESLPVSEDFNLWLRVAARWKIAFLPEVLAVNHRRLDSLSATIPPAERLRSGVMALEDVRSSCPELSAVEARALRLAIAERTYFYGSWLLATGAVGGARHELASVLKLQPTHWRALVKLALTLFPGDAYALLAGLRSGNISSL
jgi:glycosyltransferase involved in cell wall biosynthesis